MEWAILENPTEASFYFSIISNHCVCDKCQWLHKAEQGPVFCAFANHCVSNNFDYFKYNAYKRGEKQNEEIF